MALPMKSIVTQGFKLLLFLMLCAAPGALVAYTDWPRFGPNFIVGGLITFLFTSLSFLPALVGPAPRHLIYGAGCCSAGVLLIAIRGYHNELPLTWTDILIPAFLVMAAILLCQYSCVVGGFRRSWREIVAAIATVLGAIAGFVWGMITASPSTPPSF